jgi:hypothetical protein
MVISKSNFELSDVVRKFGKELMQKHKLSPQQIKTLNNIVQCRTSALGGHQEACEHCGEIRYSYNSCRDRHCPKCQSTKQAIWVENLIDKTFPVKHYHIVFTVPHSLNDLCIWNDKLYYKVLFSAVKRTLHNFGYTHFGVETGAIAVLHSWGQNLSLHPHLHCLVPAVGYSLKGELKKIGNDKFLYSVYQLSQAFKGKFLYSIKRELKKLGMLKAFDSQIQKAYTQKWVVHSQVSTAKSEHVIRYLGQYTKRVAISNHRIINITDNKVTFIAKDYRDKAKKKLVSLNGVEFLRRFSLHILPKGFVKIRRFGIYNSTIIRNLDLQFITDNKDIKKIERTLESSLEKIKRITGFDITKCNSCKIGRMIVIKKIMRDRAPPEHLPSLFLSKLQ